MADYDPQAGQEATPLGYDPRRPAGGQHQPPQGTTPTAQPQGQYQDPGNAFVPSSQGPGMLRGRSQPGMDSQNYGASPSTMMVQPWNTYGGYMGNP